MNSKFLPLYETIYSRYSQGAGFLEGDVVKLKKDYKSTDSYKALAENIKARLEDSAATGYNLRVGRLHTPNSQYGSFGRVILPATHCDLYLEKAPGSFGNLVTIPIDLVEVVDTGINLPPIAPEMKRTGKEAPYQYPAKKGKNKAANTDEQTDMMEKQTKAKKGDYELAAKNGKQPNANKYDDSKPSKFKGLKGKNKALKESVEDVYTKMLTEDVGMTSGGIEEDSDNSQPAGDYTATPEDRPMAEEGAPFDVHAYVNDVYGDQALARFERDHGDSGHTMLTHCVGPEDVDELLGHYKQETPAESDRLDNDEGHPGIGDPELGDSNR